MGRPMPVHQVMYARLAPQERSDAVLAFASNDGSEPGYISAHLVTSFDVQVDGATFFGLGFAGMVGAGLAAAVDRFLAPWDLRFEIANGDWLHLHAYRGPAPSTATLAEVQARVDLATRSSLAAFEADNEPDEDLVEDCFAEIIDGFDERLAGTKAGRKGQPDSAAAVAEVVLEGEWTRSLRTSFKGAPELRGRIRDALEVHGDSVPSKRGRDRWIRRLLAAERCASTPVFPGYGPATVQERELLPLPEHLLHAQRVAARAYDAWHDAREDPEFEAEQPWVRYVAAEMLRHLAYARTESTWDRKNLNWVARDLRERAYSQSDETILQTLAMEAARRGRKLTPRHRPYAVDGPGLEFALAGFDPDVAFMSHQFLAATAGAVEPLSGTDPLAERATDAAVILVQLGYELGRWDFVDDEFPPGWDRREAGDAR